jgi:hypothetical protein
MKELKEKESLSQPTQPVVDPKSGVGSQSASTDTHIAKGVEKVVLAIEFDQDGIYDQAVVLYREAIDLLMIGSGVCSMH